MWTWSYDNGKRRQEVEFRDGREDGAWASWHENGRIKARGEYKAGAPQGLWTTWSEDGKVTENKDYALEPDPAAKKDSSRRTEADLVADGAQARPADCRRKWQCHDTKKVCWSPDARLKRDRDPDEMDTVPECWRQLMSLGRNMVLRGQYEVNAPAVAAQGRAMQRFEATCRIDLEGDGEVTVFRATESRRTWKE